ncbi:MAG TPA: ribbon-helix-helix domain-containing protein [Candidatus Binataceae bacterium]|nr:ribbon-helix-helix domain-containing protein [Candidatus Binataceae bacterium]
MNFSVHLDQDTVERLNQTAKESGKTRNALIREAVAQWLALRQSSEWPPEVAKFKGVGRFRRFEAHRKELKPPRSPFDAVSS